MSRPMRVLIIGRSKQLTAEAAMVRTLKRLGHVVAHADDRRLRQRIGRRAGSEYIRARTKLFRPDRIIMAKPHDVETDVIADICEATPAVMWYRDLTVPPDPALIERAPFFDTVFLTAGGQAAEWERLGARRALFLPDCADPHYEKPMPKVAEWDCDIAFIGRGHQYDDHRVQFLLELAGRYHVRVWGQAWEAAASQLHWNGEQAYGEDFGRVCASARVVLGAHVKSQLEHRIHGYQSNRMVKVLAAEGFYAGHATPGMRELFVDGEHCVWYDDDAQLYRMLDRYLGDAAARDRVRRQGRAFLLQHHTFENRLHNLLTGEPWVNPLEQPNAPVQKLEAAE